MINRLTVRTYRLFCLPHIVEMNNNLTGVCSKLTQIGNQINVYFIKCMHFWTQMYQFFKLNI